MNRPRVLLVDDRRDIIDYCAELLKTDYDIVGSAQSGKSALAAVGLTAPDVIVLDISMPDLSGIEVAKQVRKSGCRAAIVFLSADDAMAIAALEAGGSAFVSKTLAASHLPRAIAEALAGRQFVVVREDRGEEPTLGKL